MSSEFVVHLNPANPGQFFACCGLMELADRFTSGVTSCFDETLTEFKVQTEKSFELAEFRKAIAEVEINNAMTSEQVEMLASIKSISGRDQSTDQKAEKKRLESLWRTRPVVLNSPFDIRIDWFLDFRSGGSRLKTWAGQQSVIDIAREMHRPFANGEYDSVETEDLLSYASGDEVTFNFDADASSQSAALDVGFSLDPLNMSKAARPVMEFLAFIGLQRFRPTSIPSANQYVFGFWTDQLDIPAATLAASAVVESLVAERYAFPLLYRTKYLKSFLPAKPIGE